MERLIECHNCKEFLPLSAYKWDPETTPGPGEPGATFNSHCCDDCQQALWDAFCANPCGGLFY